MAFELYFNISRTAIEIIALAATAAAVAYVVQDLIAEEEARANNYPVNG